jgi:hypothetical protein
MLTMTGCDSFIKEVSTEQNEEQDNMEYAYPVTADLADTGLHVEATYGFNRIAKMGRFMQVKVSIKNEGPSFAGKVNIEIPGLSTTESYQKKVEIESSSSKEYILSIPITQENMNFSIQLLSKEGSILLSSEAKSNAPTNINLVYVGILSDTDVSVDNVSKSDLKAIPLGVGDIPTQAVGLDSIDVLLVSDIQIDQLGNDQIKAIREWVRLGGSLVIPNTKNDKEVVKRFSDDDFFQVEDIVEQENQTKSYTIVDPTTKYKLEDGRYVDVINIGLGNVQFLPYNLSKENMDAVIDDKLSKEDNDTVIDEKLSKADNSTDIDEKLSKEDNSTDIDVKQIVTEIINHISNYKSNQISTEYMRSAGYDNRVLDNMNAEYVTKVPKVTYYIVVLILYIIIIGPVVYLLLRNKDRRIYIWGIIPVLSLIFIAFVYVLGNSTRIKDPFIRYLTILNIADSGYTAEDTLFTVSSPNEGSLSTKLKGDFDITSLQNQRAFYGYKKEKVTNLGSINIQNDESETGLTFNKLNAFVPLFFENSKSYQLAPPNYSLNYANYKLTGEFTNSFDFDLSNAVMLTTNTVINLGDVKAGETIGVEDKEYRYASSYDVLYAEDMEKYLNHLVGYGERYESNQEYLQVTARKNLLESYMESWLMNDQTSSYLIAFDYSDKKSDILNAFDYSSQGYRMIVLALDPDNRIDERTEFIPDITSYMKVFEGEYYEDLSMIQSDELVVQYSFGNDKISSIEYSSFFNSEFTKDSWAGFFGEAWFYNYETKQYDLVFHSGEEKKIDDLSKYMSKDNTLQAKYVVDLDYQNNNVIYVPKLTAIKEVQDNATD